MAFLQSRITALKAAGDTADQATQALTAEVMEKYPGWTDLITSTWRSRTAMPAPDATA